MDDAVVPIDQPRGREVSYKVAVERVVGFTQQFGEAHLTLACHAAFPLALTPDLLYRIWANFVPHAPWTAVADILLSRLCHEVGHELYEMDVAVRNLLLKELREDERLGQQRLNELADFLMEYVAQQLDSSDPDIRNLAQAQQWTALAYTWPSDAVQKLAQAWSQLNQKDMAELLRLSSLTQALAEPLADCKPLLVYAQGMMYFALGDEKKAIACFENPELGSPTQVSGIDLPIPVLVPLLVQSHTGQVPSTLAQHSLRPVAITLTGPSMVGKSTVIKYLLDLASEGFRPQLVPKYTTRLPRVDDIDEVECKAEIPPECDLVYEQYGARYGFRLSTLVDLIDERLNPIVIVNDFRAVDDVRTFLGEMVRSVFVWRESPLSEEYRELLMESRGVEAGTARFTEAQAIYHGYGENISLFDHVILNCGTFEDLKGEVEQIVKGIRQNPNRPVHRKGGIASPQRLFVLVGTPGSGKDLLVRAINKRAQHAQVLPKHTSRKRQVDDGSEMICPGDPGYDLDACDIVYENYGNQYGIESSRIREGLDRGVSQVIVVSNVGAINSLYDIFGELAELVYVHSGVDAEVYRRIGVRLGWDPEYIERRVKEYQLAYDVYINNLLAFRHVLIHAGLPEDLYRQMFRLFRAYEHGEL